MSKTTLVIMAAGIGSRYGGLKQIDPIGPNGELIIDYSIYDALRAGFEKIIFVITKSIEDDFRKTIGNRIDLHCETSYVFQEVDRLPSGYTCPKDRSKPWGTGHALLLCKDIVKAPFAVINADDFYGTSSFQAIYNQLTIPRGASDLTTYFMVGYSLNNTLPQKGHVARGVCSVDKNGYLNGVHECTQIQRFGQIAKYTEDAGKTWIDIPLQSIVSMNIWGFSPSIFHEAEKAFREFLDQNRNNMMAEFFLPEIVDKLIENKQAKVKVISTKERWVGVTYQDDKPLVKNHIMRLVKEGIYPQSLWDSYSSESKYILNNEIRLSR